MNCPKCGVAVAAGVSTCESCGAVVSAAGGLKRIEITAESLAADPVPPPAAPPALRAPMPKPAALPPMPPPPFPGTPVAPGYVLPVGYCVPQPSSGAGMGLAIASLVLGILWLYWLGSILAVIFGHIALAQARRSGDSGGTRGMAIAGVVLGWIGVATLIIVIVVAISASSRRSGY